MIPTESKPKYRCGCIFDIANNPPPTCPVHDSKVDETSIRCTMCNQPALRNNPTRSVDGKIIVCANCQRDVNGLMQVFSATPPYEFIPRWQKGEIIIWGTPTMITDVWVKGGDRVFPLHDPEYSFTVIEIIDLVSDVILNGKFRCTICGNDFNEPGHSHPFAHYMCDECNRLFEEQAKEEINEGKICPKCGKPLSKCYC